MISFFYSKLKPIYPDLASFPAVCFGLINRITPSVSFFSPIGRGILEISSLLGRVTRSISETAYIWSIPWFLSKRDFNRAIIEAAKNGNERIIKALLSSDKSIPDLYLGKALGWSIVNRHKEVQRFLEKKEISKDARSEALIIATQQECKSGVRELIASGIVRGWDLANTLGWSIEHDHKEVQQVLKRKKISQRDRGWAIVAAAKQGSEARVKALINSGAISEEDLGRALGWSIVNKQPSLEKFLRAKGISSIAYERARIISHLFGEPKKKFSSFF